MPFLLEIASKFFTIMKLTTLIVTAALSWFSASSFAQSQNNNQTTEQNVTHVQLDQLAKDIATANPNSTEIANYITKAKSYISQDIKSTPATQASLIKKKQAILDKLNNINSTSINPSDVSSAITSYIALL